MSEERSPEPSAAAHPGVVRRRLMVADAAEGSRQRLAAYLRTLGYEVSTAADGVEALDQALGAGPDAVILSLRLPGLDGYEVAAILGRLRPRLQVLLTLGGARDEEAPGPRQWTGSFRYFPAPLDLEAIGRVLKEAEA
jgi:CheY-like chemotaxis protein